MNKTEIVRTFLLGALVALVAVAIWRPGTNTAQAQAAPGGGSVQFFATNNGKDCPAFFIVDTNTQRFAYYSQPNFNSNNKFSLFVTRYYGNDLQVDELEGKGSSGLSVDDVKKEVNRRIGGKR